MDEDDLTIDIDDTTLEALTRMAKRAGTTVEELARQIIEKVVRDDMVKPETP